MGSKFIIELGAIKLVKNNYSITDKNNDNVLSVYSFEEALNLQIELSLALERAKEYKKDALKQKIAIAEKGIKNIQENLSKWQNELKSFDAID